MRQNASRMAVYVLGLTLVACSSTSSWHDLEASETLVASAQTGHASVGEKPPTGGASEADISKAATSPLEAKHGGLGRIGRKLSNPVSDLWAISTSWNMPAYYDGDVNTGDPEIGATTLLQPIIPIPLYGTGDAQWRMVTRPVIPLIWSQPVPTGLNDFRDKSGIGDIQLPLLVNLPESISGPWLVGAGVVFLLPTATNDALGADQWAAGPAFVLGYKTEKITMGIFPNYFWKIGSSGQDDVTLDYSRGSLLYFFNYMLEDAWQVGMNPTITYDDRATSGNQWNVPVGFDVGKTIKLGKLPVNIKIGGEYNVVSPDDFGSRFSFRIQITPVVPGPIQDGLFGK